MGEPAQDAAGRAVREVELDLLDGDARPCGVDRHARLGAEAGREREDGGARCGRQRALARQGLRHLEAPARADQLPRDALRDP